MERQQLRCWELNGYADPGWPALPHAGGAYLLPRLIGRQRAKELMFFGDALPAPDAERLGLVNRVVPDGELAKTAGEWAARLATGPTRALALTKQLVNASLDGDRATAFAAEAAAQCAADAQPVQAVESLDAVFEVDRQARALAVEWLARR